MIGSLAAAALLALLLAVACTGQARAGLFGARIVPHPAGVRVVYSMNYQGVYDYGLSEVPRFRWGYFGSHTRPTSSWYRGYSRDFRQWTFQPGR